MTNAYWGGVIAAGQRPGAPFADAFSRRFPTRR